MEQIFNGQTGRFYRNTVLILFVVFAFGGLFGVNHAAANTLGVNITPENCALMNNCTWWYGVVTPTAPGNIGFSLSATPPVFPIGYQYNGQVWLPPNYNFSMDCNNDGVYGDGSVQYGPYWNTWKATGTCYIPKGGQYTVGVKVEELGQVALTKVKHEKICTFDQ